MAKKCQEMVQDGQKIVQDGQEKFMECREMPGNAKKWSDRKSQEMVQNGPRWSGNVKKCQEMVQNYKEMVRDIHEMS